MVVNTAFLFSMDNNVLIVNCIFYAVRDRLSLPQSQKLCGA
ncbi:hypothetical protein FEM21_04710 [Flavobacterium seoulense]|uniref:Uncharacterized protein n=1 Tax=Flavobacterium seoulense TaxID=1492738 RepID=A0A066WQX8_9FLAO|nr:hypothetical protein FEM21_04710 [Flavobacterium seoulense]